MTLDSKRSIIEMSENGIPARALFVHCPKTGGTTLDSIFAVNYGGFPMSRNLHFGFDAKACAGIDNVDIRYVSGHFPVSIAKLSSFEEKLTILRSPLDLVCSTISFVGKVADIHPRVLAAIETKSELEIYREFFSAHFDLQRYLIDGDYGLTSDFYHYAEKCTAEEAAEQLYGFTRILNFDQLDAEIKHLIIDLGFFPYSNIPRMRSYKYEPDYATGKRLLSDFDEKFYSLLRTRFTSGLEGIESRYESYKTQFCAEHGISLDIFHGKRIDLSGPIGMGWHNVELSELGWPFVWSDSSTPTIEMPVANSGTYMLYLYIKNVLALDLSLQIATRTGLSCFPFDRFEQEGLSVYTSRIVLPSADWIYCRFEIDTATAHVAQASDSASLDERERGIILVNAYIKRVPST